MDTFYRLFSSADSAEDNHAGDIGASENVYAEEPSLLEGNLPFGVMFGVAMAIDFLALIIMLLCLLPGHALIRWAIKHSLEQWATANFWYLVSWSLFLLFGAILRRSSRFWLPFYRTVMACSTCLAWFLAQPYSALSTHKEADVLIRLTLFSIIFMSSATLLYVVSSLLPFCTTKYIPVLERELHDFSGVADRNDCLNPLLLSEDERASLNPSPEPAPLLPPVWLLNASYFFYGLHFILTTARWLSQSPSDPGVITCGILFAVFSVISFVLHGFFQNRGNAHNSHLLLDIACWLHFSFLMFETSVFR